MDIITRERCGKVITTFNQSDMPRNFFDIAQQLGYRMAVTGGVTLTHEIEATEDDVLTIRELAREAGIAFF